jgi:di/tricarboxylate transporter
MRRYIRQKALDSALYDLVEKKEPYLLDICLQLTMYRSNPGNTQEKVKKMLEMPRRLALLVIDVVFIILGWLSFVHLIRLKVSVVVSVVFFILLFIAIGYSVYETRAIAKIYKEAKTFILIDELIERDMILIGKIYPDY